MELSQFNGLDQDQKLQLATQLLRDCRVAFTYYTKPDFETAFDRDFTDEEWDILIDPIEEVIGDFDVITYLDIDTILSF